MAVKVAFHDGTIEVFDGDTPHEAEGFLYILKGRKLVAAVNQRVIRWVKYTES